jgi:indole-3-glycerol phosphate synthase
MRTPVDLAPAAAAGADAVLVGSAISAAADPAAVVRALAGVARSLSSRNAEQARRAVGSAGH